MRPSRRQVILAATALSFVAGGTAGAAQALTRVAFTQLNGKMFVEATVNGFAATAMVDSGADRTGLDSGFARRNGIRLGLPSILRGIQGYQTARQASDIRFALSGVAVTGPATALDYGPLARRVRHDIDAVLGGDVFRAYVVEIDFDGMTLALHDRAAFQPPAGAKLVPLTPQGQLMCAPLTIEGRGPIQAVVDLGNNTPLIVSPGPAKLLGLLTGRPISNARMGGHGPSAIAQTATARQISLGGETFDGVPILITPKPIGFDANLGLPVLSRFRLYLDFGGARMWLGEPSADRTEPFLRDRTGLEADIEGDVLKVALVAKGSPAATGGWRVGDIITRINGEPAVEANLALSLSAGPGQTVTFTLADGSVRTLVLADYY